MPCYLCGFISFIYPKPFMVTTLATRKYDCTSGQMPMKWHLGPLLLTRLTSIPAWISNHMPSKMWIVITYPFPNFNGCTSEVWEWISNFIPYIMVDVIAEFKLNHVSKRGHWFLTRREDKTARDVFLFLGMYHWIPRLGMMPTLSSLALLVA